MYGHKEVTFLLLEEITFCLEIFVEIIGAIALAETKNKENIEIFLKFIIYIIYND
jgi:hypothetical protein